MTFSLSKFHECWFANKLRTSRPLQLTLLISSLSCILFLGILWYWFTSSHSAHAYCIVIDAGSSHSETILLRWPSEKLFGTGVVEVIDSATVDRGVDKYAHAQDAASELVDSVQQVAHSLDRATRLEQVHVFLGATAGMRMLVLAEKGNRIEQLFGTIKRALVERLGVKANKVGVINGTEEGLYAWTAANYARGTLLYWMTMNPSAPKESTVGILEMGGASSQIAYQVDLNNHENQENPKDRISTQLYGRNYTLKAYSNLCSGVDEAFNRYLSVLIQKNPSSESRISVPCMLKNSQTLTKKESRIRRNTVCTVESGSQHESGSSVEFKEYQLLGTGNYDQCAHSIKTHILDSAQCHFKYCFKRITSSGEHVTRIYYATASYYFVMKELKLMGKDGQVKMEDFVTTARKVCSSTNQTLTSEYKIKPRMLLKYCFQVTYMQLALTELYGFLTFENIRFTNQISGSPISWPIGMAIVQSNRIPATEPGYSLAQPLYHGVTYLVLGLGCMFCAISTLVCYVKLRRKGAKSRIVNSTPKDSSSSAV